jgi:hypothetical protein
MEAARVLAAQMSDVQRANILVVEVVIDFTGTPVSDAVFVRWIHDLDLRVPTVMDPPGLAAMDSSFELFGQRPAQPPQRERAVVVDLATMRYEAMLVGSTGNAGPAMSAICRGINNILSRQGSPAITCRDM